GIHEGHRQEAGGVVKKHLVLWRVLVIVAFVLFLEMLCRYRVIDPFTMQPPSKMAVDLWKLLVSGKYNSAIAKTLSNAATAFVLSVTFGIAAAVTVHRVKTLREALD